jgi:O-methyltransferase
MFQPPEEILHRYVFAPLMGCGPFGPEHNELLKGSWDFVRHATMGLAVRRIINEHIPGDMAEVGVWRGDCAEFIHLFGPEKRMYLFDTFEGFPVQSDEADNKFSNEFRDTSEATVRQRFANNPNIIIKAGVFPGTASDLQENRFSLVSLDCDLYEPILEGLRFFYPRMSAGGYIFLHDHNGTGYNEGPARATREFFADKPEKIIDIPDQWGSIMIRKINESAGQTDSVAGGGKRDHQTAMGRIRRLLQTPFVRARHRLFVR